jgi:hypothetical protein
VSKKQIIIAAAAGLLSFVAAFAGAFLFGRSHQPAQTTPQAGKQANATTQSKAEGSQASQADSQKEDEETELTKKLNDKQLKSLVYEVREKIHDYENKSRELEVREARLQMTQETLKKDIEELNQMRVEMAALVANLKEQRSKLLETRAEIAQSERSNLTAIAATYDKMDAGSASKILNSMCAKQMESGRLQGGPIDDAVKILFYMTERTKAKVLGEIVTSEPKLAAVLCARLKEIVEQK